jgi:elongation factor Ts
MAEITAAMVKALREETGQGMMECKKALAEANGDVEAARDLLRKRGLVTAEKKAGRATGEGLVAVACNADRTSAAMVEARCETDFCARNEVFQAMVRDLANLASSAPDGSVTETPEMKTLVQQALAKIGENMSFSRGMKITADHIASYVHHNGKVGVIVGADGEASEEVLKDICMHIAFANPMGVSPEDIPQELIDKEKKIAVEQAMEAGKPKDIAEKMVAGKIRKFVEERSLTEQLVALEEKYGKKKVKDLLPKGKIKAFARFAVGE